MSHDIKPVGHRLLMANGTAILQQRQKGRLKGVLDIGFIGQHLAAGGQHRRPVPADQHFERRRIFL